MWGFVWALAWGAELDGHRQWRMADGLPQSTVTDLAQGRDGLLRFTTFGGLVRFDGLHFDVWDASRWPLPSIRLTALAEADDGWWLGSQEGQVVRLNEAGGLTPAAVPAGLGVIWTLAALPDGGLAVGSQRGAGRLDGAVWTWLTRHPTQAVIPWGSRLAILDGEGLLVAEGGTIERWVADPELHEMVLDRDRLWLAGDRGTVMVTSSRAVTVVDHRPAHYIAARVHQFLFVSFKT